MCPKTQRLTTHAPGGWNGTGVASSYYRATNELLPSYYRATTGVARTTVAVPGKYQASTGAALGWQAAGKLWLRAPPSRAFSVIGL